MVSPPPQISRIAAEYLESRSQVSAWLCLVERVRRAFARLRTGGRFSMWASARQVAPVILISLGVLAFTHRANAAFEVADTSWEGGSELLVLARERLGAARVA